MTTIAIAARLPSATIAPPIALREPTRRWGSPIWAPDAETPVNRDGPTREELQLAALAVAISYR